MGKFKKNGLKLFFSQKENILYLRCTIIVGKINQLSLFHMSLFVPHRNLLRNGDIGLPSVGPSLNNLVCPP